MSKLPVYSADFETTGDVNGARVWVWSQINIHTESFERGLTIDEYIVNAMKRDAIIYFHNLAFDGRFFLDYLLRNGFTWTSERDLRPGQLTSIISDMGKFYAITVRFENGVKVEFRDSLKKLPMSAARVAKAFNQPTVKGEIDYVKPRPVGYEPTPEEWEYVDNDVLIIARAVRDLEHAGMTRLTVASDSLAEYKRLTTSKQFKRMFPVLPQAVDADIRRGYKGGYTYADERFKGVPQAGGVVLDVNSLYPFVMRTFPLPYGTPKFESGEVKSDEQYPLTVFTVRFTAVLKPNHIPILQIKGGGMFNPVEYQRVIAEPTTITVTNIDWELYNSHYDITVHEFLGGWKFHAVNGLFDAYIDKWSKVKNESTGGQREIAKLHLNSLYGKFGSNLNITQKYPVLKNDVVRLTLAKPETKDPVYTAVAVFVTAYARRHTITAAQANYDTFAYCDTDSLHLITDTVPDLPIDAHELGTWKLEYWFREALFIGSKKYLETTVGGKHENHIAGVPVDAAAQLRISDMKNGMIINGKLHPKYVPGGVVLEDVEYTLRF